MARLESSRSHSAGRLELETDGGAESSELTTVLPGLLTRTSESSSIAGDSDMPVLTKLEVTSWESPSYFIE
jgi:hypothetical protein